MGLVHYMTAKGEATTFETARTFWVAVAHTHSEGLVARTSNSIILPSWQFLPGHSSAHYTSILDHLSFEELYRKALSNTTSAASKVISTMLLPLSQSVLAANVVLPTLATIAVVLRFVARKSTKSSLKADDYAILIALASLIRQKMSQTHTD